MDHRTKPEQQSHRGISLYMAAGRSQVSQKIEMAFRVLVSLGRDEHEEILVDVVIWVCPWNRLLARGGSDHQDTPTPGHCRAPSSAAGRGPYLDWRISSVGRNNLRLDSGPVGSPSRPAWPRARSSKKRANLWRQVLDLPAIDSRTVVDQYGCEGLILVTFGHGALRRDAELNGRTHTRALAHDPGGTSLSGVQGSLHRPG